MRKLKYQTKLLLILLGRLTDSNLKFETEPKAIVIEAKTEEDINNILNILHTFDLEHLSYQVDNGSGEIQIFDSRL